jgi:hypothetical protein
MTFKEWFPYYWFRAYPFILVLGIASVGYQVFCPRRYHGDLTDFVSGALIGLAIVGAVFKRSKDAPNP